MSDWEEDCMRDRGKVLTGAHAHWCPEWDGLTIDETCFEWPCGCSISDSARASQSQIEEPRNEATRTDQHDEGSHDT